GPAPRRKGDCPPAREQQQPGADRPVEARQADIGPHTRRREAVRPVAAMDVGAVLEHRPHIIRAMPRLFIEQDLHAGAVLALGAGQGHYVGAVLRLTPGHKLAIFNGRDGEWEARLAAIGRSGASAEVVALTRPQDEEADLWLLFAPIKRARIDFLVEKATEL